MNYLKEKLVNKEGVWTKFAQQKYGVCNEQVTIAVICELLDRGDFLRKRSIYPSLTNQKILFACFPKSLYERLSYLVDKKAWSVEYERTGYFWFKGYPVICI